MNFVAHLLLTHPERHISLGNLLGDMINYHEVKSLSGLLHTGVMIHRKIDSYTDEHHSMYEAKKALRVRHGKYAPVVLDILLDRVLVENWSEYSDQSYDVFAEWVYAFIGDEMAFVPDRVKPRLERMVAGEWLRDYTSIERFRRVLEWTDRRARFDSRFAESVTDLNQLRPLMRESLWELMRDLQPMIRREMDLAILQSGERS